MVLILSRQEIEPLLDMKEIIAAIQNVFMQSHCGRTFSPQRVIINVDKYNGLLYYMPSYLIDSESLAVKIVSQYANNPQEFRMPTIMASILVNDPQTGKPLALMDGAYITAMRTGAASGVAARFLTRKDSSVLGVIGTGVQARTQVWALTEILPKITCVKAFDLISGRVKPFAGEISTKHDLRVDAVETSRKCVEHSDVLIVATTSKTPVFDGHWLQKGTHVSSIGVSGVDGRELDDTTIKNAKIVVDTIEGALAESGDLAVPIRNGTISRDGVYAELHEIVGGKKPGRTSDHEITCWKSVGLAIEDAAVAGLVYAKAKKEGIGTEVEL